LAETVGYVAVDWPSEPMDPFFNINSAEDLAQAEHLLEKSMSPE
jgi:molybdopterin-guanine dinucleotide biosynthesis protein A